MFKEIKKMKEIQVIIKNKIGKNVNLKEIKAAVEQGLTIEEIINYFFFL